MGEIGYLLAAVLAKMIDPLLLAAGVIPALISRRSATVIIAAALGASLGLFVYIMSAEGGRSVSLVVVPICASASVIWWSIAAALRRLMASRATKTRR
jgi:hypothetical protein